MPSNRTLIATVTAAATLAVLLSWTVVGITQAPLIDSASTGGSSLRDHSTAHSGSTGLVVANSAAACRQAGVPLGAAGTFRVLAGTTVTSTGNTVVKGNLGVSPGTAVTGFPPGKVTGTIHKADTAAANGQRDLVTAYNNAMGRTNCAVSVAGNIGGKTLGPGLYVSTSSLAISSGDLTLTAHGHSSAVFIFQVTTKFTTTSGRQVILTGGAQAKNVYWVVGSSATLGTTSVIYGNILAHKSISMATGATLHGKALAHLGAVTMAGNSMSKAPFSGAAAPHSGPSASSARPGR